MPNFRTLCSLFSKKTAHSPLVTSAYNFINSQVCDVAFSLFFWKVETASQRCSSSCQQVLLQIFWRQQLHQHAVNESKLWNTSSADFTVKLFLCVENWSCLDTWVRMEQRWTFCTIGLVGTKVDEKTYRSCVLLTRMILQKTKKNQVTLRALDKA